MPERSLPEPVLWQNKDFTAGSHLALLGKIKIGKLMEIAKIHHQPLYPYNIFHICILLIQIAQNSFTHLFPENSCFK